MNENSIERCEQCGDYEYCAGDFDNCTGFIPGENYIFDKIYEKMKKYTKMATEEFIEALKLFRKKHGEYLSELVELNRQGAGEDKYKELREKYDGYTSPEERKEFVIVSENLLKAYESEIGDTKFLREIYERVEKLRGKKVELVDGSLAYMEDLVLFIDDCYYTLQTIDGHTRFEPVIGKIKEL